MAKCAQNPPISTVHSALHNPTDHTAPAYQDSSEQERRTRQQQGCFVDYATGLVRLFVSQDRGASL